jgi:hypothetical protein
MPMDDATWFGDLLSPVSKVPDADNPLEWELGDLRPGHFLSEEGF